MLLTDLVMPGMSGLDLLKASRSVSPETETILMTAYGTVESAVEAMKQGAYDYLPKPINMKRLRALVQKALEFQAVVADNTMVSSSSVTTAEPAACRASRPSGAGKAAHKGGTNAHDLVDGAATTILRGGRAVSRRLARRPAGPNPSLFHDAAAR